MKLVGKDINKMNKIIALVKKKGTCSDLTPVALLVPKKHDPVSLVLRSTSILGIHISKLHSGFKK